MAAAKCKICGTKLDTKTAYKLTDKNGKPKYYCSASEFEAEETRKKKAKEDRNRVYFLICDMFGYEIQNTKFFAEWVLWNKLKSDEIIYKYLRENETYLQQICDKSYDNEYGKIMYFSAILKNSLRDYQPKVEVVEKPKVVVEEHYETKYKHKTRTALLDFEEDCE
jgi:YHS domain-containing protein